jgi:hypothetical protein
MRQNSKPGSRRRISQSPKRRGAISVLAAFMLVILFAFMAMAVDVGRIVHKRTSMQNACDAAALAASLEIKEAASLAAVNGEDPGTVAVAKARQMAYDVAFANNVLIDPANDVQFGNRGYSSSTGKWFITWGAEPYNVVMVTAKRDQGDTSLLNGRLPLAFGWAVGMSSVELRANATAFVESRDIVCVLDYSASMNDDSTFTAFSKLGKSNVEQNMGQIWTALQPVNTGSLTFANQYLKIKGATPTAGNMPQIYVTFKDNEIYVTSTKDISNVVLGFSDGSTQKFDNLSGTTGTFKGTGGYASKTLNKCWIKSGSNAYIEGSGNGESFVDTNTAVKNQFGLSSIPYPYPSGSWDSFIDFCRSDSSTKTAGYRRSYGGLNFVQYLLTQKPTYAQTPTLWKTPHYPFHAMKQGMTLFTELLGDMGMNDELGLATYDQSARAEKSLGFDGYNINISSDPISSNFSLINDIQVHRQAGHYDLYTAMGAGIYEGRTLLQQHARYGSKPTLVIMTDGQANRSPSGWSAPGNWSWSSLTDYDGDGVANYTTSDVHKKYAFYQASEAIKAGFTVHTLTVGADADRALMKAIAFAGKGEWVDVPGGSTVQEMEQQMKDAFAKIAAKLPPPKLINVE